MADIEVEFTFFDDDRCRGIRLTELKFAGDRGTDVSAIVGAVGGRESQLASAMTAIIASDDARYLIMVGLLRQTDVPLRVQLHASPARRMSNQPHAQAAKERDRLHDLRTRASAEQLIS